MRIGPDIVLAMQQLRDIGQPIVITSGYRCPERNEASVDLKVDIWWNAVDIDVKGMSPQALSEKVIEVLERYRASYIRRRSCS